MTKPIVDEDVSSIVEEYLEEDGPGVAVLVINEGKVVHAAGQGLGKLAGKPISPESVFDLASVSKQFTATAIVLLAIDGKLSLDDPAKKHLAKFSMKPKGRDITIRDLLHHTSGLGADYTGDDWDGSDEEFEELTCEAHVEWLNGQKIAQAPGKSYEYNNSGYALLARIVEETSGKSFGAFLHERVFKPLGMTSSLALEDPKAKIAGRVTGYKWDEDEESWVESIAPSKIQGDGNVFTNLVDMQKWAESLRRGTLVPKDWLAKMWTNGTLENGEPIEDEGTGYGFGWCTDDEAVVVSHSGSWMGTATYIQYDMEDDRIIVVLSNDEDLDVAELADKIDTLYAEGDDDSDDEDEDEDEDDDDDDDDDDEEEEEDE